MQSNQQMKPQLSKTFFYIYEGDDGEAGRRNIKTVVSQIMKTVKAKSQADAKNMLRNAWEYFVENFTAETDEGKNAAYEAIKTAVHKKLEENKFSNLIPEADKIGDAFFKELEQKGNPVAPAEEESASTENNSTPVNNESKTGTPVPTEAPVTEEKPVVAPESTSKNPPQNPPVNPPANTPVTPP